ncbi:MAG: flagellar hook-associated protein FlgL [Thermoleophilaceae bacterium]
MSTRITNSMVSSQVLGDIQDISNRLSKTQLKLASGKEIAKPSDDPYAASRALTLSNSLEGIKQFQRNVNDAASWTSVTDTALSSINDAAQRARELVVQAGNDTNSTTSRTAIADEMDQLIESMKGDANAQVDGRYVLAGTATGTAPYTVGGADTYAGDGNAVYRTIGPNVSVQINTLGSTILGSGISGDGGLIGVLRDISTHLRAGTVASGDSLRTTDLKALDASMDTLTQSRAVVGATTNRLTSAASRLSEIEQSTTGLLSDTQDADMAQTMIDFSMQQSVYQSALHAGAKIVQASLLDFLS